MKGFTPQPNDYKEALFYTSIPIEARKVLDVIERFTFGWKDEKTGKRRTKAALSYKTFRKLTRMPDCQISRAKRKLLKMNIITTYPTVRGGAVSYSVQTDYTKWRPLTQQYVRKGRDTPTYPTVRKTTYPPVRKPRTHQYVPLNIKESTKESIKKSKTSTKRPQLKTQKKEHALSLHLLKSRKRDLEEDRTKWLKQNPGDSNDPYTKDISSLAENIKSSEKNAHNPKLQHKAAKTKEKKRT